MQAVKNRQKSDLKVLLGPQDRKKYLDSLFALDGFPPIEENPQGVYCPISLTLTPEALKPHLLSRQAALKEVLKKAGFQVYDPEESKYSPDRNPNASREEVYMADSMKIAEHRFFVGHHIIASSGFGNECEKARVYNRISIILHDRNIRVSRMEPFRTIYLAYENFGREESEFVKVFQMLKEYEPGLGMNEEKPALLGFHKGTGEIVDLEERVYGEFPRLRSEHNMDTAKVDFSVVNPEIFYENQQ